MEQKVLDGSSINPKWQAIVGTELKFLTINWGVYWNESEPQRANFDFSTIDKQVAFAEKFSMKIKRTSLSISDYSSRLAKARKLFKTGLRTDTNYPYKDFS